MSLEAGHNPQVGSDDGLGRATRKHIPSELFLRIFTLLEGTELTICMMVSSHIYGIIAPLLYRKLDIDLRSPRHPLLAKEILNQSDIPARKSLNPFSYTTHLTLTSHSNDQCCITHPLILPNLIHLRIKQRHPSPGFDACDPPPETATDDQPPIIIDVDRTYCPLLINLRPKTIELGGVLSGFFGPCLGLWTSPTTVFPPPWLENLIIHIGWAAEIDHTKRSFLQDLPKSLKRLTLILPEPKEDVEGEIWDERWKWRKGEDAWINSKHSWVKLALATAGDAGLVEIVGLEKLDGWEGCCEEERESKAMETLAFCLMKGESWPFLAAQRLVRRIKFVDRETDLARG